MTELSGFGIAYSSSSLLAEAGLAWQEQEKGEGEELRAMAEFEDQSAADAIALLVTDSVQQRMLIFWHRKHLFWTVPIGKIEAGERASDAARREAYEELGLSDIAVEPLGVARRPPSICSSEIVFAMFQVVQFRGELHNREPDKHASLEFVAPNILNNLRPLSFATQIMRDRFWLYDSSI